MWLHRRWIAVAVVVAGSQLNAQTPPAAPPAPPVPVVIGRDPLEPAQVIGKSFLLRVWLSNVGGNGVQKIFSVRVGADGNITVPGMAPIKAEGIAIGALEQQMSAALKASSPTASAWVTILDRSSPPPPAPASQPAPATQPVAAAAATTKPATLPAK